MIKKRMLCLIFTGLLIGVVSHSKLVESVTPIFTGENLWQIIKRIGIKQEEHDVRFDEIEAKLDAIKQCLENN